MNNNSNLIEFFRQETGFHRLLTDMSALFAQHGRTYGAVRLLNPTKEEEKAVSDFFRRDYYDQALIRISLGDFERQLGRVFPEENDFQALMTEFSQDPILDTRSAVHKHKDAFAGGITKNLYKKYKGTPAQFWVREVATHMRRTYKYWALKYVSEPDKTIDIIDTVAQMLNNIPEKSEPVQLSVFAANYIDSPYDFVHNEEYGTLLLRALAHYFDVSIPITTESIADLYLRAGLITSDVQCLVTVQNLIAYTADGKICEACDVYNKSGQAHVLTLENVTRLAAAKGINNKVYIIENPFAFSVLRERIRGEHCTLISTMGNSSPAFTRLLELLHAAGNIMYYAGNMDYKGLSLADSLCLKFGKQFIPWRYSKEDYELSLTRNSGLLSSEKSDLPMYNEDLALVLSQMRKTGRTGGSIALVPLLARDIKEKII
jgi:uncharacterized protein (TIGR02679 family)